MPVLERPSRDRGLGYSFRLRMIALATSPPGQAAKNSRESACWTSVAAFALRRPSSNLEMEIDLYAGVDTQAAPISWLLQNVRDPRLQFHHLDMHSALYNPTGSRPGVETLQPMQLRDFDAACMFSVITHQEPDEAELVFKMLHRCAPHLYFTAVVNDRIEGYVERDLQKIGHLSTYSTERLKEILSRSGWTVERIVPPSLVQQTALICSKSGSG
jgi:hypothetical protein